MSEQVCVHVVKQKIGRDHVVIGPDGQYRLFDEGPRMGDPEFLEMVVRTVEWSYCDICGELLEWKVIGYFD